MYRHGKHGAPFIVPIMYILHPSMGKQIKLYFVERFVNFFIKNRIEWLSRDNFSLNIFYFKFQYIYTLTQYI